MGLVVGGGIARGIGVSGTRLRVVVDKSGNICRGKLRFELVELLWR
jgi:hypothetical protein